MRKDNSYTKMKNKNKTKKETEKRGAKFLDLMMRRENISR